MKSVNYVIAYPEFLYFFNVNSIARFISYHQTKIILFLICVSAHA